jgi:hypothetical protein
MIFCNFCVVQEKLDELSGGLCVIFCNFCVVQEKLDELSGGLSSSYNAGPL